VETQKFSGGNNPGPPLHRREGEGRGGEVDGCTSPSEIPSYAPDYV